MLARQLAHGLSSEEASARLLRYGPNAIRTQRVSAVAVLGRQLRSALLALYRSAVVRPRRQHLAGHPHRTRGRVHRIQRRAARFSHADRINHSTGQTSA